MNKTKLGEWLPVSFILAIALVVALDPTSALASTSSGTEFQSLYDKLTGWINGLPGIMGAIAFLIFGIYMSFFGGKSPMFFFLSALGAAAIFLIPNLATSMGGAVW